MAEGRPPQTRLTEEEIRAAAASLEDGGELVAAETLRRILGRGSNSYLHKLARLWRRERLESLARSSLEGDIADPAMIASDGKMIVLQVPIAIPLDRGLIEHIMAATPGEVQLGSVRALLRKGPLEFLQTALKPFARSS